MTYRLAMNKASHKARAMSGFAVILALSLSPAAFAQDRDKAREGDRGRDPDRIARLEAGTVLAVRTNEAIDVDKGDNRVYTGIVSQDVRGNNGRLVIPRWSTVELIVRISQNSDLILDLESVVVNDQRYGIRTEPKRIESRRDDSLIGGIVGAISGGEARGRAVRVPRDSIVTFRLERALDLGVEDRGSMRDGRHYHDYYDQRDRNR